MGRTIVVANQKGGVGKTTTSINLAAYLAQLGKITLLIDSDPQGNATSGTGLDKNDLENTTYDLLLNGIEPSDAIYDTQIDNLYVMPANISLAGAEIELVGMDRRESILRQKIDKIREIFDYIIIDAPPSLGLLTINALTAADQVLIPIQCEYYALEGLSQLIKTISLVNSNLNPDLTIEGALLTMYDSRTNLSEQVAENVRSFFKNRVHKAVIPRNVTLGEAPSYGEPISVYDPKCAGAQAYLALAKEIIMEEK